MASPLPRALVEFILLGPEDDRRQLQDSPILGDVWIEFAAKPDARLELLITPHKDEPASRLAFLLSNRAVDSNVAYLQGIVAASLTFEELLRFVVPRTRWWSEKRIAAAINRYPSASGLLEQEIHRIFVAADKWHDPDSKPVGPAEDAARAIQDFESHQRYVALAGLILWAKDRPPGAQTSQILRSGTAAEVAARFAAVFATRDAPPEKPLIWNVSLNRQASAAVRRSVPAVKADAARTLFKVDCSRIVWAVVDSGIDATHPAFLSRKGVCRIAKSFDFTRIRDIVSLENVRPEKAETNIAKLLHDNLKQRPDPAEAAKSLKVLADAAENGCAIDWSLVTPLVEIKPETRPYSNHGTHVAGIIAAGESDDPDGDAANGMCPDILVYDFRVLAPTLRETEFAIIAALQYIRWVNERNTYITIHGANLSLSIRHDVRNYACGRTPICNECERLINSGVVVVAAAGNRGYQNFETKEGLYESYAAFSITDPGNGDGVITVGATHRFSPHTYGVSFFSSRGPTGDGRLKPDLVAPGERIRAPLPGGHWGDLDGTSMAAPHVSGAAAMLMARYSELVGQPRRIKQILCDSATDLRRESSFQGRGMLDVLRAFQSL